DVPRLEAAARARAGAHSGHRIRRRTTMSRGKKIEQKVRLSRREAARWLGEVAKALDAGGTVEIALSGEPVRLHLGEELTCQLEIEPYGDKVELEIEVTRRAPRGEEDGPEGRARPAGGPPRARPGAHGARRRRHRRDSAVR